MADEWNDQDSQQPSGQQQNQQFTGQQGQQDQQSEFAQAGQQSQAEERCREDGAGQEAASRFGSAAMRRPHVGQSLTSRSTS